MGRKSALTPEQLLEVERRHFLNGESLNSLAKEFGVNESTLRRKIKPNKAEGENKPKSLIQLATEKADADRAAKSIADEIAELPIVRQQLVVDMARRLANICDHVASAAEYSAATSHRLAGLANSKVLEIDDSVPLSPESFEALRSVNALTEMANKAAHIPLSLLAANKETVKELNQQAKPLPQRVTVTVEDASVSDAEAQ